MQETLRCAIIGLLLVGNAWGQLSHGDRAVTVVNAPRVRARSAPNLAPDTFIAWISRGTQMKLLGKRGTWYRVILPDGREAFVHSNYAEESTARDLLEVKVGAANVRKSSTRASAKIGSVKRGDMLLLDRERNEWYLAVLPDGRRGWIHKNLVIRRPVGPPAEPKRPRPRPQTAEPPKPLDAPAPVEKAPKPRVNYYRRGMEYVAEKRTAEAIGAFRKALEADPMDGSAHFELAKLLKSDGKASDALEHFRKALVGRRPRPEARFHIGGLTKPETDAGTAPEEEGDGEAPAGAWVDGLLSNVTYFLPGLAIGSLVFLVVLGLIYRRRRVPGGEQRVYRRRKPDAGFDSVLKYAVERRPLLRAIEEAERKRTELDKALGQQFDAFSKGAGQGGPRLPSIGSAEALLKKVEDLRQIILNQEERAQVYSDLVVLQNEKLDALDEEIDALKKLIQLDYRDVRKQTKAKRQEPGKGAGKP